MMNKPDVSGYSNSFDFRAKVEYISYNLYRQHKNSLQKKLKIVIPTNFLIVFFTINMFCVISSQKSISFF
jgi:hypothetical protein